MYTRQKYAGYFTLKLLMVGFLQGQTIQVTVGYSGVKHDHLKADQKMMGDQLLSESGSRYEAKKIAELQADFLD
jgi:hypothetical protein